MQILDTAQLEELISQKGYRTAIFDVFDTIIHRKIHPEDIKKISCDRLLKYYQIQKLGYEELYQLRAVFERELCINSEKSSYDLEFRFYDLVTLLYNYLNKHAGLNVCLKEFEDVLLDIELTAELTNQFADECIVKIIGSLAIKGVEVVICSDIFYNKETIQKMLTCHGVEIELSNIVVSSEHLLTKRTGRLFNYLSEKWLPKKCVMIGDNHESDYNMALEKGFSAIHIDRTWIHELYKLHQQNFPSSQFENRLNNLFQLYSNTLFKEFALTSFYFMHLLCNELKRKKISNAFFLAREGQILKEMFDLYQEYCMKGSDTKIKSHYLKVSRRSTFLPSLKKIQNENFFNLFRQYRRISTEEFLLSIGFTENEIENITSELGIDKQKRETDFPTSASFIKLLLSDNFINSYERKRSEQKGNFNSYVNSFINSDEKTIAIVDVGWKGTIQDNIHKALSETIAIDGFYIGLVVKPDNTSEINTKKGLLFSAEQELEYASIFDENRSFFEVFFAANHGSAVSYKLQEQGNILVETEDFTDEVHFYKSKIFPQIQSIMPVFKDICQLFTGCCINEFDLRKLTAENHARMFLFPSSEEVSWFTNLYHVENFGIFERSVFDKKTNINSLFRKINNYFDYKKGPEKFTTNVAWPVAELLKNNLPKAQINYSQKKFNATFN